MRLAATVLFALAATPAFGQAPREEARPIVPPAGRTVHQPPPEGFYRNIDGAYDLLFRPYVSSDIQLVNGRRLTRLPERLDATRELATPAPPPCETPPTANAPAAKPAGPTPCPATR
jgi:hypothetical protein